MLNKLVIVQVLNLFRKHLENVTFPSFALDRTLLPLPPQ